MSAFPRLFFSLDLPTKTVHAFSISYTHAECPDHVIPLLFHKPYNIVLIQLCNSISSLVTPYVLGSSSPFRNSQTAQIHALLLQSKRQHCTFL